MLSASHRMVTPPGLSMYELDRKRNALPGTQNRKRKKNEKPKPPPANNKYNRVIKGKIVCELLKSTVHFLTNYSDNAVYRKIATPFIF